MKTTNYNGPLGQRLLPCLLAACFWTAAAEAQEHEDTPKAFSDIGIADATPVSKDISGDVPDGQSLPVLPESSRSGEQSLATPGAAPGRSVKPSAEISARGAPFQLGTFLAYPEVDVTWSHDSNIYSANTGRVSDSAMTYSPSIWINSNWVSHALSFHAAADSTRYRTYQDEDSDDYKVSVEGRYDFNANANVYGGVRSSREHEERESPSARNGLTPTEFRLDQYYAGIFRQSGPLSLRVAGTAQKLNFDDVAFITSGGATNWINNDDRDRWQYTGGVRVAREISANLEPYVLLAVDQRRYQDVLDDLGYGRDSDGERYLVGVRWVEPKKLKLDAFAGYLEQDYEDSRFDDIHAPVVGFALQLGLSERTTAALHFDRTAEETTVTATPSPGVVTVSSGFINSYATVGLEHRVTDNLSVRANGSVSHADYEGLNRVDKYYGASIGGVYRLHRNLFVDVSATERKLKSSLPNEDFDRRMVFVRLAMPLSH